MGILNFFKKQPETKGSDNTILLAMPLFKNGAAYQIDKILEDLKLKWNFKVTDFEGDDLTAAFNLDGETVALAFISMPVPIDDIKGTAAYAYNWPAAMDDLKDHTGHAIVSLMKSQKTPLERFQILTKVLCSTLNTSDAVGIYDGNQSLLIPRTQYLENAIVLKEGGIPVTLWVYIGLKKSATGNSAYTYGLKAFQKMEIEIIDSKQSLEELFDFIFNITSYVINNDVTLNNGETVGLSATQKIMVRTSKGQFVEGVSIKLNA